MMLTSCGEHFMSESAYRKTVEEDLSARIAKFGEAGGEVSYFGFTGGSVDGEKISPKEKEAMEFLYAYMPLADVTDYSEKFFLDNVRASFRAQDELSWGKTVPEKLFRHFVLPLRANNENLDSSRVVFYRELKPRVEGLSMKEAILEVNHWCHEKVTYYPSDARTASPLTSVSVAFGRCGEESTFTVAALRAVGIPARQVYTPRWAHTDDNHAWVEAWADGQWWFLGACEPEPTLNLGWFNAPASRAMLMHTKTFGKYDGPEEVVLRSPNYTEINLIDNYASTDRVDLEVVMPDGTPADGARVDFMIYNYAEFYPAVAKYTDGKGRTFLTAGLGDMLAWASKDGLYGFSKLSFGKDKEVRITLDGGPSSCTFDIVPPPENVELPEVTPEMRAENDRRFAYEDSLRHAYMATFMNRGSAEKFMREHGCDPSAAGLLVNSNGNHKVIEDFIAAAEDKGRAVELLSSLSWKDLKDVTPEILWDSYNAAGSVLCPRVEDEFLSPYKSFLLSAVPGDLADNFSPSKTGTDAAVGNIVEWINENILVDDTPLTWRIAMSPEGVWNSRLADNRSRAVFFVALARTFGIDARRDQVTGKLQYRDGSRSEWKDVDFGTASRTIAPSGTLVLTYSPSGLIDNPGYYSHFTLSRIDGGRTSLLNFDEGQVDMGGGASWSNTFRNGSPIDAGTYLLVSGNRLADGSVPVTVRIFDIADGQRLEVPLDIRIVEDAVSVIGQFDSESKYYPTSLREDSSVCGLDGNALSADDSGLKSILSQTGRGYFAVAILGVGGEPTNHVLRDIAAEREALEAWGRPILMLCTSEGQMARLQTEIAAGNFGKLPSTVIFGVDRDGSILSGITGNMELRRDSLPVVFIADTFNRVVFVSQGYTIGLGARLAAVADNLK